MKKFPTASILFITLLSITVAYGASDQWPTWRGPDMAGVSPNGKPPLKWSESENIKWKIELVGDESDSSPIIWGDQIIFQSAVEIPAAGAKASKERESEDKPSHPYEFNVVSVDRKTGKQLWKRTVTEVVPHEGHHPDHGFCSYSPVTDGTFIWANFGSNGLYCLDMKGNIKWEKELWKLEIRAGFGEGNSPVLAGDNLVILMDQEGDSSIAAFNKNNGDLVWKKDRDERTSWTSPRVVEVDGKLQVIVNGHNRIRSYDSKTGDLIWECGGQTDNVVPTPVIGFGMVFCASGFRGNSMQAIKLGKTGDLTDTDAVVWHVDQGTPYVPSPVLADDKIYVFQGNKESISCYNAKTGEPYYIKQELEEMKGVYSSGVFADGKVYLIGRGGTTYVLENSDTLKVLAVNKLDDGIDCSPAIIGNELYLKGKKYLYCIADSK
jgi:outer membrane protein assembly factor BamB